MGYGCELCLESGGRVSFDSKDAVASHISEFHNDMRQNFRKKQAEALTKAINTEGIESSSKESPETPGPDGFNEVNLSDKDSAIKLGAIIRIDFFVINSNAKSLSLV